MNEPLIAAHDPFVFGPSDPPICLLVQQRSQIACAVQDAFDTYTLIIDRKENHIGAVSAGPNSLLQFRPFDEAKRCLGDLARVLQQFIFKLAGAFGIIESDEVRYLDEIRLRPTRAGRALLPERHSFIA